MSKRQDHWCKAKTKRGTRCRAAATAGGLCFFHGNPNKASELGRKGGKSHRHSAAESVDPLPRLDNAMAVRDTVDRLVADLYSGQVQPRLASGLATLLSLQLRAIETTDHERRIAELEKDKVNRARASNGDGEVLSPVGENLAGTREQ
jgi:hypothetical protein